ncbi:hypothetical protein PG997_005075 [Apiospora hydei]|uniref:C2H2-type domain-containing protein n=1 Tax=Apiospora hydei TaxID=1337664 RepID=A0ABR1X3X5_9PEZI
MAYDTFSFSNTQAVYPSADHLVGEMIDPGLKYSNLAALEPTQWYPYSFPRALMAPNSTQYFTAPAYTGRQSDGMTTPIPSLPAPMHARQETPSEHSASSSDLSSGSSDHIPSTPPDEAAYPFQNHYDPWSAQSPSQMVEMTGMSDGVKLGDVNSLDDEVFQGFHEEKTTELPLRSYTMSSMGSSFEMDPMGHHEPIHFMRQTSPTAMTPHVKEEICIPNNYPPPEPEDDDNTSMDENEPVLQPIQDDEDDEDYKPKTYQRRGSNAKRSPPGSEAYPCSECHDVTFKDETGLQNHIKKQHTRPFTCLFAFAGCHSTFAAKNEWKRHVASQHLLLFYWLCSQGTCTKVSNSSSSSIRSPHAPNLPNGAIFNRKDLYTQHVRRMHVPLNIKKQLKQKNTVPEWEDSVQCFQKEAHKPRCSLPEYMTCPAAGCAHVFNGASAWDEHMEHLAKHLEKAASGIEQRIVFNGENHPTLVAWASRPDVAIIVPDRNGSWILNNPLSRRRTARPLALPDSMTMRTRMRRVR